MSIEEEKLRLDEAMKAISHLRENSVGRLLLKASRQYNEAAMRRVRELGHEQLNLAHAAILPHIDLTGTRVTELAARAGMTKQSVSELISALEHLGYVMREPHPVDRRSHQVSFTKRGEKFLSAAYQAKLELEEDLRKRLGKKQGEQLIALLREYIGSRD